MSLFEYLHNDFCLRLAITLAHFLWQAAAVGVLAGFAGVLLRKSAPATRYWVFLAALGVMAICPLATFALVAAPSHGLAAAVSSALAEVIPAASPAAEIPAAPGLSPHLATPAPAAPSAVTPPPTAAQAPLPPPAAAPVDYWKSLSPIASGCYLLGVLLMLARLLLGLHGGRRLRQVSEPVTDSALLTMLAEQAKRLGLRFMPAVACCGRVAVPVVVGVLRPMILLPLSVTSGLTAGQVESILAHELAHIRRYDPLVNLLQRLVETFLFYHPATWYVSRRIRLERENCCDDLAVAAGTEPFAYAETLLHLAQRSLADGKPRRRPAVAIGATDRPSQLRSRIRRLLEGPEEGVRLARSWPVALLLLAAVVAAFTIASCSSGQPKDSQPHQALTQPATQPSEDRDEGTFAQSANLKVSDVIFGPLCQGRNSVRLTVESLSDIKQVFAIHIYTRSPQFGPGGLGWGMPFFATIEPGEKKDLDFTFKIQGPVTDDTYVILSVYNPLSEESYDFEHPFKKQTYLAKDLQTQQKQTQTKEQEALLQAFQEFQQLLAQEKYSEARDRLSGQYRSVEFQNRGLKSFEGAMKGNLLGRFIWSRQELMQLKPISVMVEGATARLSAERDAQTWTIRFVREQAHWKIDWIDGYTPDIARPATQPAPSASSGPSTQPAEVIGLTELRATLTEAYARSAEDQRNLHIVAYIQEYEPGTSAGEWVKSPAYTKTWSWYERRRDAAIRIDFDPEKSKWIGGAAPYCETRYLLSFNGSQFRKFDFGYDETTRLYRAGVSEKYDHNKPEYFRQAGRSTGINFLPEPPGCLPSAEARNAEGGFDERLAWIWQDVPAETARRIGLSIQAWKVFEGGTALVKVVRQTAHQTDTIVLDPQRGYSLVRAETLAKSRLVYSFQASDWKQLTPNLWFPVKWTAQSVSWRMDYEALEVGFFDPAQGPGIFGTEDVQLGVETAGPPHGPAGVRPIESPPSSTQPATQPAAAPETRSDLPPDARAEIPPGAVLPSKDDLAYEANERIEGTFTVIGGVARPGRWAIDSKGTHLLEALKQAGGLSAKETESIYVLGANTDGRPGSEGRRTVVVSVAKLMDGDPRANVVLRDGQTILVPPPPAGEFYVMGDVKQPGVYNLTGRKVSLKQALAAAGKGPSGDWPKESVLIRNDANGQEQRIPLNVKAILSGDEPDLFLRPDDIIAIGVIAKPAGKAVGPQATQPSAAPEAPQDLPPGVASDVPGLVLPSDDDLEYQATEHREGTFSILGGVVRPGTYPIDSKGMRLLDAVGLAGGLSAQIDYLYVRPGSQSPRTVVISVAKLMAGDPRVNVVIRDGEIILATPPQAGEFYVLGEVQRPGVYSMNGRHVNVKMALAAAGGSESGKWPENAVLIRHVADGQEQRVPLHVKAILDGDEPDLFLRPDDLIAIGTGIKPAGSQAEGSASTKPATQPTSRPVDAAGSLEFDKTIPLNVSIAGGGIAGKPTENMLTLDTITFNRKGGIVSADIAASALSCPKTRWVVQIRLVNAAGRPVAEGTQSLVNSGVAADVSARPQEKLTFALGQVDDVKTACTFEVSATEKSEGEFKNAAHWQRHFARLVISKDSMTFQGKAVTWDDLPAEFLAVQDRQLTALEVAVTDENLPAGALMRAMELAKRYGFEYASYIGKQELGSLGSPTQEVTVGTYSATYVAHSGSTTTPPAAAQSQPATQPASAASAPAGEDSVEAKRNAARMREIAEQMRVLREQDKAAIPVRMSLLYQAAMPYAKVNDGWLPEKPSDLRAALTQEGHNWTYFLDPFDLSAELEDKFSKMTEDEAWDWIDSHSFVTFHEARLGDSRAVFLIHARRQGPRGECWCIFGDGHGAFLTPAELEAATLPVLKPDELVTFRYDIGDLLRVIPDFSAPPVWSYVAEVPSQKGPQTSQPSEQKMSSPKPDANQLTRQDLEKRILTMIHDTVARDTWQPAGPCSVRLEGDALIVTQTHQNHGQLKNLLRVMRRGRILDVPIEAKFLHVPEAQDKAFLRLLQGHEPATKDDSIVATLTDADSILLQARRLPGVDPLAMPRMFTLYNGQKAYVLEGTDTAMMLAEATDRKKKVIMCFFAATSLEACATVTPDRKNVTLTLLPRVSTLLENTLQPRYSVAGLQKVLVSPSGQWQVIRLTPQQYRAVAAKAAPLPDGTMNYQAVTEDVKDAPGIDGAYYLFVKADIIVKEPVETVAQPAGRETLPQATQPAN